MHTMRHNRKPGGSNDIWSYFCFLYTEISFATNSYYFNFFLLVCKLCKSLHFGSVKIHKHCLYWKDLVLTYKESFFSPVCCSFIGRSTLVGERPMKSLLSVCPSICLSVCPWLSFLKIGSLAFFLILHMMIANHDI